MPIFEPETGHRISRFGAALGGRLQGFDQGVRQDEALQFEKAQSLRAQEDEQQQQRQTMMLMDNRVYLDHMRNGRFDKGRELLVNRISSINQLGGDPQHSQGLLDIMNTGDNQQALSESQIFDDEAVTRGFLDPMGGDKPKQQIVDGQLVTIGPDGAVASDIEGLREDTGAAEDRALRSRQLAVSEAAEKRQSGKLSAGLEKALLTSQDRVVEAQRNANEYEVLASDFERLNLEGGLASTFSETLKNVLGSQDQVSEFRRKFNQVRISQGIKNLPPGPASDVDVKMAMKGVPKESASAGQVASFLRGSSRIARFDAGYNQFKADFITQKRSGAGLNKSWRSSVQSPGLKRKVSIAEIYETAQNRGITPEDVAAQLGIKEALF